MQYFNNKKGTTLVELIVAFALAAIFMTTAVALITPFTNVYMRILNMNRIHDISDVVMEKVTDELTYASVVDQTEDSEQTSGISWGEAIAGTEHYKSVGYRDKSGSLVTSIKSDETTNGLTIHYKEITASDGKVIREAVDWTFGSKGDFYKGNIVELEFAKVPGKNQIHVFLKVSSKDKAGKEIYSQNSERYVECIDLVADQVAGS